MRRLIAVALLAASLVVVPASPADAWLTSCYHWRSASRTVASGACYSGSGTMRIRGTCSNGTTRYSVSGRVVSRGQVSSIYCPFGFPWGSFYTVGVSP